MIRIVSIILIARYLGVEEFGKYAFVRGIGIVVTVIIAWANLMIIIREVAVDRAKASVILTSALVLHITMGIISYIRDMWFSRSMLWSRGVGRFLTA